MYLFICLVVDEVGCLCGYIMFFELQLLEEIKLVLFWFLKMYLIKFKGGGGELFQDLYFLFQFESMDFLEE